MIKTINQLKEEFKSILTVREFNYIIKQIKFAVPPVTVDTNTYYEEIIISNIQKYVLGKFEDQKSKNFLNNYTNQILEEPEDDLIKIKELCNLYKTIRISPEFEDIYNLIKTNEKLFECLNNILNNFNNLILSNNIEQVLNDENFVQIMTVFLDIKGITFNETDEELVYLRSNDLDSLVMYYKELEKYPVLNFVEEQELFKRYANGDTKAKEIIVKHNLRLVAKIAVKKSEYTISNTVLDLIQEGNIGLITAIDKFDYTKGFKFSTYATWYIRREINYSIAEKEQMIKYSHHLYETKRKYDKAYNQLLQELNREPTIKEIINLSGLSKDIIDRIRRIPKTQSLNQQLNNDDTRELEAIIQSEGTSDFANDIPKSILNREVLEILNNASLSPYEMNVILLRFGLIDGDEKKLREIGEIYHVTRERIRQIETRALKKIRQVEGIEEFAVYMDNEQQAANFIEDYNKNDWKKSKTTKTDNSAKKRKSLDNIREYYSNYPEELILDIISSLPQYEQNILKERYGSDFRKINKMPFENKKTKQIFYSIIKEINNILKQEYKEVTKSDEEIIKRLVPTKKSTN